VGILSTTLAISKDSGDILILVLILHKNQS
jgi:hypothetical protein